MRTCSLAIETTSHEGQITLGEGETVLETAALARARRHNLELMPGIDALCARHGIERHDLQELYVALGPGSFTGVRIALATVKMLAFALSARVVGVPSLEVVAANAPIEAEHIAVALNLKRGNVYSQLFEAEGETQRAVNEPGVRTLEELLSEAPRPVALIGETLPELPPALARDSQITRITGEAAMPRSEMLWRLGRARARAGLFDEPGTLAPHYGREPEAVTLWRQKQG